MYLKYSKQAELRSWLKVQHQGQAKVRAAISDYGPRREDTAVQYISGCWHCMYVNARLDGVLINLTTMVTQ